ncbi:hypothetical protein RM530_16355 [Algiphilus sp. W345]|uniref:Uncharacterized protein n=1 Tax=Banduia mediterranea TaxID=3075609 RepID=A0ABU2WM07_9GAMM|nr:hypothetical protein [Algiphilus sp. W345]MDT0498918.1 hypothetical protein [Algiphilus sp. W345]
MSELIPAARKQFEPLCGKVPQARREPGRQAMSKAIAANVQRAHGIGFRALKLTPAGFVSTRNQGLRLRTARYLRAWRR